MQNVLVLQITLFILIGTGALVKKKGLVSKEGQKNLTDLVIYVVLPCNIVTSFLSTEASGNLSDCTTILLVSVVIQVCSLLYGFLFYKKQPEGRKKSLRYGILCSNAGFLGNPVAEGLYGPTGLMLASVYLLPLRIMMWSEGLRIFAPGGADKKTIFRKVLTHPCVLACLAGLALMLCRVSLPPVLSMPLSTIGRCNTALSMFVIGMVLADMDPKKLVDKDVVRYTLERLILIPCLVLIGCRLFHLNSLITGLSVVLAAMPAGATTSMLAVKYDQEPEFATRLVIFSTLCSIPTICMWSLLMAK